MATEKVNATDSTSAAVNDPPAGTLPRSRTPQKRSVQDALDRHREMSAIRGEAQRQLAAAQHGVSVAQQKLDDAEDECRIAEEELLLATGEK